MQLFHKVILGFLFVHLFLLLSMERVSAQAVSDSIRNNFLFFKNHVSFSLMPAIVSNASTEGGERYNIGSSPQFGFDIGINYHYNMGKCYSLIYGLHGGVLGRNIEFSIPKNEFNPSTEEDIFSNKAPSRDMDLSYFKIPIELERRWVNAKKIWNASVGVSVLYSFQNGGETSYILLYPSGQQTEYLYQEINTNNNNKPWLNYHLSGGRAWLLHNNNLLKANLVANVSFTDFAKGTYAFTIPGRPEVAGSYKVKGSYIGLSVSYVFTGVNNRLRELHSIK